MRTNNIKTLLSLIAAVFSITIAGCDGNDSNNDSAPSTETPTSDPNLVTVEMTDQFRFSPAAVTIKTGQTVRWTNTSNEQHTATGDPSIEDEVSIPEGAEPFNSGLLSPGQQFSHTFTTPGTYHYICLPHYRMGMVGTITVTE